MKDIYIIRHGETDFNRKRIVQGSGIDSDLNEIGRQQADLFYSAHQHIDFDMIITSRLKRSIQTVKPFIDRGIDHLSTKSINEIGWGIHEGKGGDISLRDSYQRLITEWTSGNLDARVPGGESASELIERCQKFMQYLRSLHHHQILVCTHGRTLRCLICLIKEQEMAAMEHYRHANTGLFHVKYNGSGFEVIRENDISHLTGFKG